MVGGDRGRLRRQRDTNGDWVRGGKTEETEGYRGRLRETGEDRGRQSHPWGDKGLQVKTSETVGYKGTLGDTGGDRGRQSDTGGDRGR